MRIRNLSQFSAYSVIGTVTLMPLLVLPAMVGVLVDEAGMSVPFAGWVASVNFFGGAVIALLMALRIHRLDLRRIAAIGLTVSILADSLSALVATQNMSFLLLRFLAGIAAGSAHIAAIASFARHEEVERGYGLFVTLQFIVSGLGLYVLPVYAAELGVKGMYLMFALLGFLALFLIQSLPGRAIEHHSPTQHKSELTVLLTFVTILAILGYGLFEAANTAQFTYVERFGISLDLSGQQIGSALLIASLIGIPGAFTIVVIGHRFGRLGPLSFGLGTAIAGLMMLIGGNGFTWYFAGSCCLGFSWAFCLPYIQSLMASLDPHGSAIAAGSAAATIGGAAGPGLAALIVGDGQYRYVFLLAILLFLIAMSSFLVSERRAQAAEAIV